MRFANFLSYCAVLLFSSQVAAQMKSAPLARRGVDMLALRDGPTLLGSIVNRDTSGTVRIAVERRWLKEAHPKFYAQAAEQETAAVRDAYLTLRARLRDWMKARADDKDLLPFLTSEMKRIEAALAKMADGPPAAETQFLLVEVPARQIRRGYRQPAHRKQIALVAWRERLAGIEHRDVDDLLRELQEKGIDPAKQQVDLSDRLRPLPETERQWAARRAIIEYEYGKRLDYQGTGELMVATGDDSKPVPIAQIVAGLYQARVGRQLADLLEPNAGKSGVGHGPPKWLEAAMRSAAEQGVSAIRFTRVEPDLEAKRVSVEENFLARMPDGSWETVWSWTETSDASQPRLELEKEIARDPRVQNALKAVRGLGLVAGEESIGLAVRFGAATAEASRTTAESFTEFRERYRRRLDGPPLRWTADRRP